MGMHKKQIPLAQIIDRDAVVASIRRARGAAYRIDHAAMELDLSREITAWMAPPPTAGGIIAVSPIRSDGAVWVVSAEALIPALAKLFLC